MALKDKAAPYIEQHEGRYAHMYLDHKGLVTVGVGYYLTSAALAAALPFRHKQTKRAATKAAIQAEWKALKALNLKNHKASYFAAKTTLELTDAQISRLFMNTSLEKRISLASLKSAYDNFKPTKKGTIKYAKFSGLPESAQIALWDMAYALGVAGLKRFKNLLTACKHGDFTAAASACKIANTRSQTRNNNNKAKFQKAGAATKAKKP